MTFDRLMYIDRLEEAGIAEHIARAHAEALREALLETVATEADVQVLGAGIDRRFEAVHRKLDTLDRKVENAAPDLIIKRAGGLVVLAGLMIGLKLFG